VKVISAIVLADLTDCDAHNQLDAFIGQHDTVLFKRWFQVRASIQTVCTTRVSSYATQY
jgi:hypothetical protein